MGGSSCQHPFQVGILAKFPLQLISTPKYHHVYWNSYTWLSFRAEHEASAVLLSATHLEDKRDTECTHIPASAFCLREKSRLSWRKMWEVLIVSQHKTYWSSVEQLFSQGLIYWHIDAGGARMAWSGWVSWKTYCINANLQTGSVGMSPKKVEAMQHASMLSFSAAVTDWGPTTFLFYHLVFVCFHFGLVLISFWSSVLWECPTLR